MNGSKALRFHFGQPELAPALLFRKGRLAAKNDDKAPLKQSYLTS
jgi:hypothetical protein